MAFDFDIWDVTGRTVRLSCQRLSPSPADIHYLTGVAFQKHLSNKFDVRVLVSLSVWKVPWGVERFRQSKVLLGNDSARNTLEQSQRCRLPCVLVSRTDLSSVFMNLSISFGRIRSWHSNTPIASLGITVKCS